MRKVVFLDRDGVINVDEGYVGHWIDFKFIDNSVRFLQFLRKYGFDIVLVTNQSGIARGFYTVTDFLNLSNQMCQYLAEHGVSLLDIFYCPHHPEGEVLEFAVSCSCRKPLPGMFLQAKEKWKIDMQSSIMVGDKVTDLIAAHSAGVGTVILLGDVRKSIDEVEFDIKKFSNHNEMIKYFCKNKNNY